MKLIKIITIIALWMNPLVSQAVTIQDFCEGFVSVNRQDSASTLPWYRALQVMFKPRSIISPHHLDESQPIRGRSDAGMIYVNLPDPKIDYSIHSETLKKLDESRVAVAKLDLYQKLKKVHDQSTCESLVSTDPVQFKTIQDYLELFTENQVLMNQIHEKKSRKLLLQKLKPFIRKGWKLRFPMNHVELAEMIHSDSVSRQIMLVSHADSLGRIYDAKQGIVPKGFFSNLPVTVLRVIQYSCFSEKVAEFYGIHGFAERLEYVVPKIRESFAGMFSDRTPVMAIRGMLKLRRLNRDAQHLQQSCALELDFKKLPDGMAISLNDHLIGYSTIAKAGSEGFSQAIPFYCDLLNSQKVMIKVFYLDSSLNQPLGVFPMSLKDGSGKNHLLDVKEFLSTDRKRHLLTLGTLGGPL